MNDLLAGTVDCVVMDTSTGAPFVRDGRVRALCSFNEARMQALPDVPTLAELGYPTAVAYGWQGVGVQAGTPDATVAAINRLLVQAIASEEVATRLRGIAVETVADDPARFAAFIARENAEWRPLIRDLGIRLDS
jgi:tripartite-type tricarboxylate transporter receptor subunit TctC